jgi:hypothetical protein
LVRLIEEIGGGASPGTASRWPTPDGGLFGNQPNANTTQWGGNNTLVSFAENWSTPRVSADRVSRGAMVREGHWSAPSLGQMAELSMGELPREYHDETELTPQARRIYEGGSWPTPNAPAPHDSDHTAGTWREPRPGYGLELPNAAVETVSNWPTPHGFNGRDKDGGYGTGGEFEKFVKNWPTPAVTDSTATANQTAGRSDPDSKHHDGVTLTDAIRQWPTPQTADGERGSQTPMRGDGNPTMRGAALQWATPSARDWRSGDASDQTMERNARPLNEQVVSRWATPDTFNRKSRKALTASTENGRRSGGGNSSPPGLEQMAELHAGVMPPEMEGIPLPPATRTMVESLWPTPDASVANDGEGPETWRARQEILKEKHVNGNGAGVPLSILAQEATTEWATPNVPNGGRAMSAADVEARGSTDRGKRQVDLGSQAAHWATPRASDSEKGGPHQQFGAGGTPLPARAVTAWATPNTEGGTGYMSGSNRDTWRPTLEGQALGYRAELHRPKPSGRASRPDPATETAGAPSSNGTPTSRLQLNARFVSILMGLPPGWTCVCPVDVPEWIASAASATRSSPGKRKPRSVSSGTAPSVNGPDAAWAHAALALFRAS